MRSTYQIDSGRHVCNLCYRLETMRREQEEESLAECSFSPKLVAHVPWPLTQKKPPAGLQAPQSAGQRMYAEGLDARRQWQLHLQKLRQVSLLGARRGLGSHSANKCISWEVMRYAGDRGGGGGD